MTTSIQKREKIPVGGLLEFFIKISLAIILTLIICTITLPLALAERQKNYDSTQNVLQLERTYGVKLTEEQAYQIGVPSDSSKPKIYQGVTGGITVTLNGDEVYLYGVKKGDEFQLWSCSPSLCRGKELPRL